MKQKLETELKKLAKKILETSENESLSLLKRQAQELYEKLTILSFTEENLMELQKNEEVEKNAKKPAEKISDKDVKNPFFAEPKFKKKEKQEDEYLPDGTQYNHSGAITEPNTEKIKDIVAQMGPETQRVDTMVNHIMEKNEISKKKDSSSEKPQKDFRDVGVDYDNLPDFEPVKKQEKERPKSLNDRLKKGINIGLNERLSFIRYLFNGNATDYNRVVSQLNTFDTQEEADKFIQLVVKPDYQNWEGKEEHEKRFMGHVENKFD